MLPNSIMFWIIRQIGNEITLVRIVRRLRDIQSLELTHILSIPRLVENINNSALWIWLLNIRCLIINLWQIRILILLHMHWLFCRGEFLLKLWLLLLYECVLVFHLSCLKFKLFQSIVDGIDVLVVWLIQWGLWAYTWILLCRDTSSTCTKWIMCFCLLGTIHIRIGRYHLIGIGKSCTLKLFSVRCLAATFGWGVLINSWLINSSKCFLPILWGLGGGSHLLNEWVGRMRYIIQSLRHFVTSKNLWRI